MANFVTSAQFDARTASAYIFGTFVLNFSHEVAGSDVSGFDGHVYSDFFVVVGGSAAELALGGEFDLSGQPTGTVEYLSVADGDDFRFYLSELDADLAAIVPQLLAPIEPGSVHPALLYALSGNDEITLSGGTDYFDAGTGFDQVIYNATRAEFSVAEGDGGQLQVQADAVPENADTLDNVEKLTFTDGSLIFDVDSDNASFAYRIYAAAYGRTPDEGGFRFWADQLDQRGDGPPDVDDKEFIASYFLTADEFINLYGENPTNEQYINALYQNVLHREADQGGYDFWLAQIAGGQGKDDLLIYFTDSDENLANTAPDLDNGIWVL